jgi:hypothetical protein
VSEALLARVAFLRAALRREGLRCFAMVT